MDRSLLVRVFGFPATLIHGDPLVLSRWLWLAARLPRTRNGERLLDVGCGSGAFTIGAALQGYSALGLSWDARNQAVARERASLCGADAARFEVLDVRELDARLDLTESFEVVACLEVIEHVLDDRRLFAAMAGCLAPGGRLLLTAPYRLYRPLDRRDQGPFDREEHGWHVRKGYDESMLRELCETAGLSVERLSYCGGLGSQYGTRVLRVGAKLHPLVGWATVLPLRPVAPLLDAAASRVWPSYSIGLEAYKPRFVSSPPRQASSRRSRAKVDSG